MYSRNLGKSAVRASPTYLAAAWQPPSYHREAESYRCSIPAGYDGSRFSRLPSAEGEAPKHHTAPKQEEGPRELHDASTVPKDPPRETLSPALPPQCLGESRALDSLIAALKDHVSGEDLLLVVIILLLAAEGEQAEITILLLSLLLLIK